MNADVITAAHPGRSVRSRVDRLEQRCALLWTREPAELHATRESTLRALADLERRVASIALRSLTAPDHPELDREVRRCEKDLAVLAGNWIERPAA